MLTMVPGAFRATMSATTACMRKNGALRLTATCASNNSGVVSSSVPRDVSPAALTRQSTRPKAATAAVTHPRACATAAPALGPPAPAPDGIEFGHQRLAWLPTAPGHHDPRALPRRRPRDRRPEP